MAKTVKFTRGLTPKEALTLDRTLRPFRKARIFIKDQVVIGARELSDEAYEKVWLLFKNIISS